MKSIYVIGSLRNPEVPVFANQIAELGFEAFSDWYGAGERADDAWKEHELLRGRSYREALKGPAAQHVFNFDKYHLDRCDAAVLLMPGGKSAHLELGYTVGRGKKGFLVFEEGKNDRWDVMVQFATETFFSKQEFLQYLKEFKGE